MKGILWSIRKPHTDNIISGIMCGDHKAGAKTVTLHDIDETLKEFMDG